MAQSESLFIKSNVKYRLFFAFTPFNLLMVEQLLEGRKFVDSGVIVINTSEQKYESDFAQVINFSGSQHGLLSRLLEYRRIAHLLNGLLRDDMIHSVTAPHPHNLLSNALMLGGGSHFVNIYEDGTANYCASNNVGHLKKQSLIKFFIAPILGFRYQNFLGHITGIDEKLMDNGYFLSPEDIYKPERFSNLHAIDMIWLKDKQSFEYAEIVLVLDQKIEQIFDGNTAKRLRDNMKSYVNTLAVDVYVKPHPAQLKGYDKNWLGRNVIVYNDGAAAELLALELRPKFVVSFFSSALKNIANILPESKCVSFGIAELNVARGISLGKVFSKCGIDLL